MIDIVMNSVKKLDDVVKGGITNLGIILSRKCNFRCAHCITLSSPGVTDFPLKYEITKLLKDAAELSKERIGPKVISFSGGEPFLYMRPLCEYTSIASDYGFKTEIVTNCFWARSKSKAEDLVKKFNHVTRIDISTDLRHSKFIPEERIINAIVVLKEYKKLGTIHIVRQPDDGDYNTKVSALLSRLKVKNKVFETNLVPLNKNGIPSLKKRKFENKLPLGPCISITPMIYPSGLVYACCGVIQNLQKNNPLYLGNLNTDSLRTIYTRFHTNPFIHSLRIGGVREALNLFPDLIKNKIILSRHDSKNMCYSCYHSMNKLNKNTIDKLKNDKKEITKYAMYRCIFYGEDTGIDLMPEECLNSAEEILKLE